MSDLSFSEYVCPGDCVYFSEGLFSFRIHLEPDTDARPYDCECYSKKAVKAWERDEWFYCGLVVSGEYNGVPLARGCLASLWGVEANFPGTKNRNFVEIVLELLTEAKEQAREALEEMRAALDA